MQSAFSSVFGKSFGETSYPYAVLDENLDAITDLLGNVIEEEF